MSLANKNILLGISASIAAYKSAELVRQLTQAGADVRVVMTRTATEFIAPLTFQALSGHPVGIDEFESCESSNAMDHIALARWADAILIAPASANTIAKLAHGSADDLLSSVCLVAQVPIAVAPAMNQAMWSNHATQDHRTCTCRERQARGSVHSPTECNVSCTCVRVENRVAA